MALARHMPGSAEELKEVVADALAAHRRLEIVGGGTQRVLHAPILADAELTLEALRGVEDYDPEELVIRARAGTPLAEVEGLLAERAQMLAFEPFDLALWSDATPGRATLGGMVAANLSGPRRLTSGAARDHVLGFTAVSGRAELLKGGGAVVKNVTGFDLPKLMTGSLGTLAVLATLTLRVVPRPPVEQSLLFQGLADEPAHRLMTSALGTAAGVSCAAHMPALDRARSITALRLEGFGPSVEARARELARHLAPLGHAEAVQGADSAAFWQRIKSLAPLPRAGHRWWRVSVPPARGHAVGSALAGESASLLYDWGGGLVWVALADAVPNAVDGRLRVTARLLGGHARLVKVTPERRAALREAALADPPPRSPLGEGGASALRVLNERIKQAFDPAGILNPGLEPAAEL